MIAMADGSKLGFMFHHFVFLLLFIHGYSSYLPGASPVDYERGELVGVKANKLTSTKTHISSSFYSIPYCRPQRIISSVQNLGEILRGDHIQNSPYMFEMRSSEICNVVCRVTLNEQSAKQIKEKIDAEYRAHMVLNHLPLIVLVNDSQSIYQVGYDVGGKVRYTDNGDEKYFINNHLSFKVDIHRDVQTGSTRIVRFQATTMSINHKYEDQWTGLTRFAQCDPRTKLLVTSNDSPQEVDDKQDIIFTYDVEFRESNLEWASRMHSYHLTADDQIHWFPIVNSLMTVLLIAGMLAAAMLGTLYRCINTENNQPETLEEAQEETGWKVVRTDVFRAPVNADLLCVCVGTGVQFFGVVVVTAIFGVLGFLSPLKEGRYETALFLLWALTGIFGGFFTARLYKTFGGSEWVKTTLKTACMFPGTVVFILLALKVVVTSKDNTWYSAHFSTTIGLMLLWFGLSLPLVFLGSYLGFKQPDTEDLVKTNEIPREIPEQSWYMNPLFTIMIGGIIPFAAIYNELFFMLSSIGLDHFYYILALVLAVLIITCADVTIMLCYFQLCGEDYRWWWRSYLTSGFSGFYLFIYATFYFFTKMNITEVVPGLFYFGYMLIACFGLFVLAGTIGFYACLWFTRLIYSSVKVA